MSEQPEKNRRDFLRVASMAGLGFILSSGPKESYGAEKLDPDKGVTAPEDLMKEHGVLSRCLLIYEAGMRRLRNKEEVPAEVFHQTASLIRSFVEQYHEKNEEKYIFPVFEKQKRLVGLVETLKTQHMAGRNVTARIISLAVPGQLREPNNRTTIIALCESFIRMYRPHKSREDTVLFPALRTILAPRQVTALGDRMEEDEHKVLGTEGFEKSVAQVESIEKMLGIYDLGQFTPE
jgi:hemerythrin-like domain-containing protein